MIGLRRFAQRSLIAGARQQRAASLRVGGVTATRTLLPAAQGVRFFSKQGEEDDNSHPDFMSQSKVQAEDDREVQEFLDNAVKSHDVLLFMKGTPQSPQCGFSMKVVKVLQNEGIDFSSANVLSSAEIREGIKKYSDWPTIPQLYVQGEFIGGCDIVTEMHASGELAELLKPVKEKQQQQEQKQD